MDKIIETIKKPPVKYTLSALYIISAAYVVVMTLCGFINIMYKLVSYASYGEIGLLYNELTEDVICTLYNAVILLPALVVFIAGSVLLRRGLKSCGGRERAAVAVRYAFRIIMCLALLSAAADLVDQQMFLFLYYNRLVKLVFLAVMLIGALSGELLSVLLMKEHGEKPIKRFSVFLVISALMVTLFACVRADVTGRQRYVPDAEDVESVSINNSTIFRDSESLKAVIGLHRLILDNRQENENHYSGEDIEIVYKLKNGDELRREYYIGSLYGESQSEQIIKAKELINSHEAIDGRYLIEDPESFGFHSAELYWLSGDTEYTAEICRIYLTEEQFYELYKNGIAPDIADGRLGTSTEYISPENRDEIFSSARLNVYRDNEWPYHLAIEKTAENSLEWLCENIDADIIR